jgi:uncharacterized protein YjiS (DUF1127 family)
MYRKGISIMTRFTASEKVMLGRAMAPAAVTRTIAPETIGRALRDLTAAILRPLRRQAIVDRLERLDDRLLADIGVQRFDIDAIADTVASRQVPSVGVAFGHLLGVLIRSLKAWSERRAAYRELSALDDRMLSDIGITRADIPAVIAGMTAAGHADSTDPLEAVRRWARSRAAAADLHTLDNRTLDDIGMVRGDIDWVAEDLAIRSLRPANTNHASQVA